MKEGINLYSKHSQAQQRLYIYLANDGLAYTSSTTELYGAAVWISKVLVTPSACKTAAKNCARIRKTIIDVDIIYMYLKAHII